MKITYNVDVCLPEKTGLAPNMSDETRAFVEFMENDEQKNMCMDFDKRVAKSVANKLKAYAKRKNYAVEVFARDTSVYAIKIISE